MPQLPVVVLVEGRSDAVVVELLARRGGLGQRCETLPLGGITNVGRHVARLARERPGVVLLGMCDAGERRFMEQADPPLAGVFVCARDLEDELIRALGAEVVEGLLAGLGDLGRFRTFQDQPEWRGRSLHEQLRRFAGTRSGRKAAFAARLAAELTQDSLPSPLARLLERLEAEVGR